MESCMRWWIVGTRGCYGVLQVAKNGVLWASCNTL